MSTDKARKAIELAMKRIGCPPGDNADADLYRELQSAISELEAQPSQTEGQLLVGMLMDLSSKVAMVGGLGGTRDWIVAELGVIISHVQDAQPSAPTVDQIMEVVRKADKDWHDYYDDEEFWEDLRARLTKLLTNP